MRVRDALYENVKAEDYKIAFAELNKLIEFVRYPVVIGIHGDYGTGKTRMLKGLRECAKEANYPTTWFNTSDYDADDEDLLRVLLAQMGRAYHDKFPNEDNRANFFGLLAGSIDAGLAFCSKKGGILAAIDAISKAKTMEREQLMGPWANYADGIQLYKEQFALLADEVCAAHTYAGQAKTWFIFLDDMDRLFPADALKLILSLRGIIGGPPDIDNEKRPRVAFIIALNMTCLRAAIKQRYSETYREEAGQLDEFVEQYLRKLFLIGPAVPIIKANDGFFESYQLEECIEDYVSRENLRQAVVLCEKAKLAHRTVLLALDRMQLRYFKLMNLPDTSQLAPGACFVVFCLELARTLCEKTLDEYLAGTDGGGAGMDGYISAFAKVGPMGRFSEELRKASLSGGVKDASAWSDGMKVCRL